MGFRTLFLAFAAEGGALYASFDKSIFIAPGRLLTFSGPGAVEVGRVRRLGLRRLGGHLGLPQRRWRQSGGGAVNFCAPPCIIVSSVTLYRQHVRIREGAGNDCTAGVQGGSAEGGAAKGLNAGIDQVRSYPTVTLQYSSTSLYKVSYHIQ